MIGGQLRQAGTVLALGSHRGLHQALRTYRLTTLSTSQVGFNLRVNSTSHFSIVNLSLASPVVHEVVYLSWLRRVLDVPRLAYPLCPGQRASDLAATAFYQLKRR